MQGLGPSDDQYDDNMDNAIDWEEINQSNNTNND